MDYSLLLGVHAASNTKARPALALIHLPRQEEDELYLESADMLSGREGGSGGDGDGGGGTTVVRRSAPLDESDDEGSDIDDALAAA
eukprot:CAMPEP_0168599432 /NCGR_PEP_ID=MMETSP0420-20121227/12068_1 /TAXON_ID=498008 /ORGANISM="Pessonella sp." /LENGTH=85 /DNA_ID=CAMNT_0008637097 /DNA_START=59 /DNA_END=313 /DNA_ORIENTATION=-